MKSVNQIFLATLLSILAGGASAYEFSGGTVGRVNIKSSGVPGAQISPPGSNPGDIIRGAYSLPSPDCLFWLMDGPSVTTEAGRAIYTALLTAKASSSKVWVKFSATNTGQGWSSCTIQEIELLP